MYRKKIDDWTEPTIKYHLTITNRLALDVTGKFVAKDVEKLDPSYTVGVAVIRCGHFLKINLKVAQHVRIQINKRPTPS